ncbi:IS607 family transposase [Saccharothrix deserti]|uniref:IS607 family transposase n=1 Tax=Saccharothrix deserti TaxID=2593674 RepID=UPI00131EBA91|nr:IS607 family transposase [Saccharothrix deserti]
MVSMYRISEFALRVGRSASTIRRWEREGRITAKRTASGQRYFTDADVRRVLQPGFEEAGRQTVVYCRVSTRGQKSDLDSQVQAMERFCLGRGLAVDRWITEVGGGMDLKREKLLAVMDAIERGEIATLVVAHTDRLARFGFDYLEHVAEKNGCTILVANQESLSPLEELVQDLLSIVHTFSHRLHGLRRYEKALRDALGGGGR